MADNDTEFKPGYFMQDVFKKWHRSGFISFKYWVKEEKVLVEIGTIDKSNNLSSSAKSYVNAHLFLAYLKSEVEGNVGLLFPDYPDKIMQLFGGSPSSKDGYPISRVFTSLPWRSTKDSPADLTARAFSCGEYKGKLTNQGAITPIYAEKLAFERVKLTLLDLAELYQRLRIQVESYAVQKADLDEVY